MLVDYVRESAREENIYGVSAKELAKDTGGQYLRDFQSVADKIKECKNDAVVIMGAGDIINVKKFI